MPVLPPTIWVYSSARSSTSSEVQEAIKRAENEESKYGQSYATQSTYEVLTVDQNCAGLVTTPEV